MYNLHNIIKYIIIQYILYLRYIYDVRVFNLKDVYIELFPIYNNDNLLIPLEQL